MTRRITPFLIGLSFISPASAVMAEEGIVLEAAYTGEVWHNASGGLRQNSAYLDNLDVTAEFDMDALAGWSGTKFFVYGLYNNNNVFSETIVGDAQTVSNIDATRAFRLYEAWMEKSFGDDRGSIKLGLYDLNSEFDAKENSGLFIGSSHGIGPDYSQSGENGPSIFPSTSLAARLQYQLSDGVAMRVAVLDAVPNDPDRPKRNVIRLNDEEGALLAAELDMASDSLGRLGVGTWYYTSETETLLGGPDRHNKGLYAFWEKTLGSAGGREWNAFLRAGFADSKINQFSQSFQAGATTSGLFAARPDDEFGFAVSRAVNSNAFEDAALLAGDNPSSHETVFELTYRMAINDWIAVQPDIQYTVNPGGVADVKDALSLGIRFEIGFSNQ
ncbi:MAG: carbohydrate porin [Alphaproteobacteria bacterium]|nr:carbohydrate porin [Alphaproteobacteria bacterium]